MYMSIYKNKTKHICKQKNSENKFKKREKKTILQRQVLEVVRKLLTSVVGNNKKERQFWAFSDEKKVVLVGTGNDRQVISITGGDIRQWLSRFEVEREKTGS